MKSLIKRCFTKAEQSNWDKWYSDYAALGGNSDIKRMDDLIQAARIELTLGKTRKIRRKVRKNEKLIQELFKECGISYILNRSYICNIGNFWS